VLLALQARVALRWLLLLPFGPRRHLPVSYKLLLTGRSVLPLDRVRTADGGIQGRTHGLRLRLGGASDGETVEGADGDDGVVARLADRVDLTDEAVDLLLAVAHLARGLALAA
jgi:hypothetical protein